jgi:hypothetical protein
MVPRYRRFLPAMALTGAAIGLPTAVFIMKHPNALDQRFREAVSVWRDHPTTGEVAKRITGTYFQHLASLDFLFRTGSHTDWVNIGEGLLPLWLFAPLVLGIGSLWRRRKEPFYRVLVALWLFSPIPVSLTWENLPHTNRYLHFGAIALVVGALGLADFIDAARPRRALLAGLVCAALGEGALSLRTYFDDYATRFANAGGYDNDMGRALETVFANRKHAEQVYLPPTFFDLSGVRIAFYADMDPVDFRTTRFDDLGIHFNSGRFDAGAIVVMYGSQAPAGGSLLGKADRPNGMVAWSVYRMP